MANSGSWTSGWSYLIKDHLGSTDSSSSDSFGNGTVEFHWARQYRQSNRSDVFPCKMVRPKPRPFHQPSFLETFGEFSPEDEILKWDEISGFGYGEITTFTKSTIFK